MLTIFSLYQGNSPYADMKVMLPTRDVLTIKVGREDTLEPVYRMVAAAAGIQARWADFFALYEIMEHNFGECIANCDRLIVTKS